MPAKHIKTTWKTSNGRIIEVEVIWLELEHIPGMSGDYSDQTTRANLWIQRFALLIRTSSACLVQHLAALPPLMSLMSLVFAQKPTLIVLLASTLVFKRWKRGRHEDRVGQAVTLPKHDCPQVLWCSKPGETRRSVCLRLAWLLRQHSCCSFKAAVPLPLGKGMTFGRCWLAKEIRSWILKAIPCTTSVTTFPEGTRWRWNHAQLGWLTVAHFEIYTCKNRTAEQV